MILGRTTTQTVPDIGRSINHNNRFSDKNRVDSDVTAAGGGVDGATIATSTFYSSYNHIRSNEHNSIFIPASTSKYPIKQGTIGEELNDRFINFFAQCIKAIIYLARK